MSLSQTLTEVTGMTMEKAVAYTSNTIAVGAVATPVWFPYLLQTSEISAALLPIFGLVWICVQMISHFKRKK